MQSFRRRFPGETLPFLGNAEDRLSADDLAQAFSFDALGAHPELWAQWVEQKREQAGRHSPREEAAVDAPLASSPAAEASAAQHAAPLLDGVEPAPAELRAEDEGASSMVIVAQTPTDTNFSSQWALTSATAGINVRTAWSDYTGRGVEVAVLDDGFDHGHVEMRRNYSTALDYDWRQRDDDPLWATGDNHGTAVLGTIAADRNGTSTVGVAYDATFAGLRIGYGANGSSSQYGNALRDAARFDVANNSWGYSTFFQDNFNTLAFSSSRTALEFGTSSGRDGLGTVYVFSAGNNRSAGDNVNYHNYANSIHTIAVAATDSAGRVASFSNPGAALLVSAPGVSVLTTDITGAGGYNTSDRATMSGTSFSAPIVSGVAALMLDANAALGWRDVQEILAYSSTQNDAARATWKWNKAGDWNGGGLHTSTDYGFGLVNAQNAVRLAETWTQQNTTADMATSSAAATTNAALADNGVRSFTQTLTQDLKIDHVVVSVDLRHTWIGDLRITLVSPSGTESVLVDRPGVAPGGTGAGSSVDNITFDLSSTQFWGEGAAGSWTLRVQDVKAGDTGSLVSWKLAAHGDAPSADNTYVYTNEFGALGAQAARAVLNDQAGVDAINAAAVTSASAIDLADGATIAGRAVAFAAGTVIERAFAGDGADTVRGNAADNWIWGGRGNDILAGREGNDAFAFGVNSGQDTVEDFAAGDVVWLMDGVTLASLSGSVATLSDGSTITAANNWQWSVAEFQAKAGWLV